MVEKDATIADLRKLVDELQGLKANLEETLAEIRRQLFGTRSEKEAVRREDAAREDGSCQETPQKIEVKEHTRERKRKSRRDELYAGLPVRKVIILLSDEQRHCGYCNAEMATIGYTDVREELRITPAVVERIRYKQEVALCPECKKDGDGTIEKAAVPTVSLHSPDLRARSR